jgi:peptidoglycan/LPS O-acetylase OafA/YrhL
VRPPPSPAPGAFESGTAPEDRPFRPDVEGLRAIAILLVVLFHVGIPQARGGFIGVDVFFVISGFVITGLLLRQQASGGLQFLAFYARRAWRILPMALLVIVVSTIAVAIVASHSLAVEAASDGRWSALSLANFHFLQVTPTIISTRPSSPFQQYWSLAVEEQFYLVYPAVIVAFLAVPGRWSVRIRLAVGIAAIAFLSFADSLASSHVGELGAYYLPFGRAWELGVGALLAIGTGAAEKINRTTAAVITWAGLAVILVAAWTISLQRAAYPGWIAAVPVLGTAMVIAGGSPVPPRGAEALLRLAPFRKVGQWSYSWYLWHWPFLVIAADAAHTVVLRSSIAKNLLVVGLALVVSAASYHFIENPIRRSATLAGRPAWSIAGAVMLIMTCVGLTFLI